MISFIILGEEQLVIRSSQSNQALNHVNYTRQKDIDCNSN